MRLDMRDFDRLTRDLVSYQRITAQAIAFRAAKEQILDTTSKGQRADGSSMGPYSTAHAKRREKRGLQTSHIDLRFADGMLASLQLLGGNILTVAAEHQAKAEGLLARKGDWITPNERTIATIETTLAAGIERTVR
jgi:hypothetical protein